MNALRRTVSLLTAAARNPRYFVLGVIEFRQGFTTHVETDSQIAAYDWGREFAHVVTLRRFDWEA